MIYRFWTIDYLDCDNFLFCFIIFFFEVMYIYSVCWFSRSFPKSIGHQCMTCLSEFSFWVLGLNEIHNIKLCFCYTPLQSGRYKEIGVSVHSSFLSVFLSLLKGVSFFYPFLLLHHWIELNKTFTEFSFIPIVHFLYQILIQIWST